MTPTWPGRAARPADCERPAWAPSTGGYARPCGCADGDQHTGTPFERETPGLRDGPPRARPWPASCPTPWSRIRWRMPAQELTGRDIPENVTYIRPLESLTRQERERVVAEYAYLTYEERQIRQLMSHRRPAA